MFSQYSAFAFVCLLFYMMHLKTNQPVTAALQVHVGRLQVQISGAPRRPATAAAMAATKWR